MKTLFLFLIIGIGVVTLPVSSLDFSNDNGVIEKPLKVNEHHSCSGSSYLGGTCNVTCKDACNCFCQTGLFYCNCYCECPGDPQTQMEEKCKPEIAPKERWDRIKGIIEQEESEVAARLSDDMDDLYALGEAKDPAYCDKAKEMEKLLTQLQPSTLEKMMKYVASEMK